MSPWRPTALLSLQVVLSAPPTPLGTQRTAARRARPSIGPERSPRDTRRSGHTCQPCAARSPHRSGSGAAPAAEPQLGSDFPRAPRPTREILARLEIGTPPAARPATGESATRAPAAGPSGGPEVARFWPLAPFPSRVAPSPFTFANGPWLPIRSLQPAGESSVAELDLVVLHRNRDRLFGPHKDGQPLAAGDGGIQ